MSAGTTESAGTYMGRDKRDDKEEGVSIPREIDYNIGQSIISV